MIQFWETSVYAIVLHRRGSNVSLTLDMCTPGCTEQGFGYIMSPREQSAREYLQAASNILTEEELHKKALDSFLLQTEFFVSISNFSFTDKNIITFFFFPSCSLGFYVLHSPPWLNGKNVAREVITKNQSAPKSRMFLLTWHNMTLGSGWQTFITENKKLWFSVHKLFHAQKYYINFSLGYAYMKHK